MCPTAFEATFTALFVLIYWLREFPLSAVANSFEQRCQLKQLLVLHYKICTRTFIRISIPWPTVVYESGVKGFDLPAFLACMQTLLSTARESQGGIFRLRSPSQWKVKSARRLSISSYS